MVIITDIYLSAVEVKQLKDLDFTVAKAARYEEMPTQDGQIKSKLVIPVKLSNDKVRDWIPNKTSIKKLVGMWDDNTDAWIGKTAKFELAKQNVRGEMKDIIFVADFAEPKKV
ncbi:hypothetical protein LCGC14_1587640 [marine sediment metagenome]|uniref:Uncharacterized protein n=1 Tax=marine sediment metagenome TaxID=412755 RepID=A0A0F9LFB5_9ZZZZ